MACPIHSGNLRGIIDEGEFHVLRADDKNIDEDLNGNVINLI